MKTNDILTELESLDLLVMANEPTLTERRIQQQLRLLTEVIERIVAAEKTHA